MNKTDWLIEEILDWVDEETGPEWEHDKEKREELEEKLIQLRDESKSEAS